MKHICFYILLCFTTCFTSFAQNNKTIYYTKNWKVTSKDSAYYYSIFLDDQSIYRRTDYVLKTNSTHMSGSFSDKEMKTREGASVWYYDNGFLKDSIMYKNGVKIAGLSRYEDGKKKEEFNTTDGHIVAKGWNKEGEEIPNYIPERPAEFPGGFVALRKFLEKNLQKDIAGKSNAPNGNYTVKVEFAIDEKGKVSDVKVVDYPPMCPLCAVEAARVMQKVPDWIPAIQLGRPVLYKAIQYVTFQKANK